MGGRLWYVHGWGTQALCFGWEWGRVRRWCGRGLEIWWCGRGLEIWWWGRGWGRWWCRRELYGTVLNNSVIVYIGWVCWCWITWRLVEMYVYAFGFRLFLLVLFKVFCTASTVMDVRARLICGKEIDKKAVGSLHSIMGLPLSFCIWSDGTQLSRRKNLLYIHRFISGIMWHGLMFLFGDGLDHHRWNNMEKVACVDWEGGILGELSFNLCDGGLWRSWMMPVLYALVTIGSSMLEGS